MKSFFYQQLNEELLVEKKLQDQLKQQLQVYLTPKEGEEYPQNFDDVYKKIVDADPTIQGQPGQESGDYINWIARTYLNSKRGFNDEMFFSICKERLKIFNKYKQWYRKNKDKIPVDYTNDLTRAGVNAKVLVFDINRYKSASELTSATEKIYDIIKHYGYDENAGDWTKEKIKEMKTEKHTKYLYRDDRYEFLIPLSHQSGCFWGLGTKWCTSSREDDFYFNNYANTDNLYILIDKKENKKYQFHVPTGQYMNADDSPIDNFSFLKDIPEGLKEKLREMLKNGEWAINSIEQAYNDNIDSKIENLEIEIQSAEDDISSKQRRLEKVESEIEDLENSSDEEDEDKEAKLADLESDRDQLTSDIGDLEDEIYQHNREVEDIKSEDTFQYNEYEYDINEFDIQKFQLRKFQKALG